ncbi:ankyrin repeat domain-containing protein [Wolbachia endosymbiont (group A) of Andrena bucephala]|uniref:ankyrin repeat domain-containing protein n=1 Tax=Wolbachia endosymbiont (group A) of Andrena bucephala TaxID=3066189 RepID=UPI003132E2AB
MSNEDIEFKQAFETNPGDEKWLEQEKGEEFKKQSPWENLDVSEKLSEQKEFKRRLKLKRFEEQLESEGLKNQLEWEEFKEQPLEWEEYLKMKRWEKRLELEGGEEQLEWEEFKKQLTWENLDVSIKLKEWQDWLEEKKWSLEDNEHELIRECFFTHGIDTLIDSAKGLCTTNLMHAWFCDESDLTENQKKLNKKLLNILSGSPDTGGRDSYSYSSKVHRFLERNKDDLKTVLNLKRGESGLTVLHAVVSMAVEYGGRLAEEYVSAACLLIEAGANPNIKNDRGQTLLHYAAIGSSGDGIGYLIKAGANPNAQDIEGKTPLHYAAGLGYSSSIESFLWNGAKCDVLDETRKTPLQIAIDNHQYHIKKYFPTDNQKRLNEELHGIMRECSHAKTVKNLKEFLDKHEGDQDLKVVLNFRDEEGKSIVLQHARDIFFVSKAAAEVEDLLLKAGATDQKDYSREKCLPKSRTLWDDLIPDQKKKLNEFFDKVHRAQDMKQLEEVVDQAIRSGIRFNFPIRPDKVAYQDACNFTDHVIKKISALKESSKIANQIEITSDIVYKLLSRGAVFHNLSSIDVINTLESEFKDHTTNVKEACGKYINNTLKFMKIVKSAANGRVKNVKMDNSTFYLEYSENSKIDIAKITDGARGLWLTQGEIEYGRDIIKIGKSEVEIITKNGIRNYTDLADNSDIALTFYTSEGELEVNLYPDKQDKDKIIVEVSNKKEILEKFKNCKEELGENCSLGGYLVYNAIEQGYFERSGKLIRSEAMSQSNGQTKKSSWIEREERRRAPSLEETVSRA